MTEIIIYTLQYISNAPFFWGAMGFTTAIGMFIGALIYDGELNQVMKGIISTGSYIVMIVWMSITRIANTLGGGLDFGHTQIGMAYAGIATALAVSVAWTLGMLLGVLIFCIKYKSIHRCGK